jgi:hypothetical protein
MQEYLMVQVFLTKTYASIPYSVQRNESKSYWTKSLNEWKSKIYIRKYIYVCVYMCVYICVCIYVCVYI